MKLKKLLKDIPIQQVKGSKEVEITGICANSKLVAPGNLFIARRGRAEDGVQYIPEAVAAGAVAVLTDIYDPSLKSVVQLVHPDITEMEALLAAHYYQFASDHLFMVGITGTNGKTTTSFLVKHLMDQIHGPCGIIGTIGYIIGQQQYQASLTTPEVTANHKMLREMVLHGCRSAVMEVTSHALDQGRVRHIEYDAAIFTNLTVDHLDYHVNMDQYCVAKNKLFTSLETNSHARKKIFSKIAIVNADSPWHVKMLESCRAEVLTFGIDNNADLRATQIEMTGQGSHFLLSYKGKTLPCKSPMIGRYNVYNVLGAVATALAYGTSLEVIAPLINTFTSVPGRLEPVSNNLNLKIYVDFAHTDDALTNVLECLHEIKKGRIITVFGCGGDRDRSKRPRMAQACEALSDLCIVTTDNPRSEDPADIIRQILKGFQRKDSHIVEIDRHEAIARAIDIATPNDIILIAGKGHESYQVFSHKIIEFDDRKVAAQICQQKCKNSAK